MLIGSETVEPAQELVQILEDLQRRAGARLTGLLGRDGQILHLVGEADDLDPTALATLIAGSVAATEGVAQMLGVEAFSILLHEGREESLHVARVGGVWILMVLFGREIPLGLVRLRVRQALERLEPLVAQARKASQVATREAREALQDLSEEEVNRFLGRSEGRKEPT